jgi:archaemetzincin
METRPVEVVPLGDVDERHAETAMRALADVYGCDARVARREPLPAGACDEETGQYRADELLEALPVGGLLRLGVTDVDLTYRRRNYVFGVGYLGESRAVCSTYRLDTPDTEATAERLRKQAVKQVGHLLGLENCDNRCAMQFAPTVDEVDVRPETLCRECRSTLASAEREPTAGTAGSSGSAVAPSKADIEAIEASGDSDADRKGWGEQVVDEGVTTVRFTLTLAAFALSFVVVGAGTYWLVEDVFGAQLGQVAGYGVLLLAVLGGIYLTVKLRRVGRAAYGRVRD